MLNLYCNACSVGETAVRLFSEPIMHNVHYMTAKIPISTVEK
jgi:hypothetical protein